MKRFLSLAILTSLTMSYTVPVLAIEDVVQNAGAEQTNVVKAKKEKTIKVREKKLKFSYKEQREFETIDEEIAALEDRLAAIEKEYLQFSRDFVKLGQLEKEKAEKEALLEEKMERWEYLNELAEAIEAQNAR